MRNITRESPTRTTFGSPTLGVAAALATVFLYSANFIVTRAGVLQDLTAHDLVALRYGVAGLLLLPLFASAVLQRKGGMGWRRCAVLTVLAGAPYMTVFNLGLSLAPASHGAVLNPGFVPVVVAFGSIVLFGQAWSNRRFGYLALIVFGLALLTSVSFAISRSVVIGDGLLLLTGLSWGIFTLLIKHWDLKPLQVTAAVSVASLLYLPVYAGFHFTGLPAISSTELLAQAVFHGVVMSVGTLFLVALAIRNIGADRFSLFSPLIPLLTAIAAAVLLNETLNLTQWAGAILVIVGMVGASRAVARARAKQPAPPAPG